MQVLDPAAEFTRALSQVLVHEGRYSNYKADPGGETMKGVTSMTNTALYRR